MTVRAAVILAAGQGTRMRSALPKVLHPIGGKPVLDHTIALAQELGCALVQCVVSPRSEDLKSHVTEALGPDGLVVQNEPLGTAHAVLSARDMLADHDGHLIVLYGDSPLIRSETIEALFSELETGADLGVLGFEAEEPGMYGRLITGANGDLEAIVEARDATPEQLSVRLCNSGVMAGDARTVLRLLDKVDNKNAKGEYYLTDLVGLARAEGLVCRAVVADEAELMGCDTRADLAAAEAVFQGWARQAALEAGVTLIDPATVWFSHDTELGEDVTVEPNVVFGLAVRVGQGTVIKAFSHIEGAVIGENCSIGPHARLRPGTELKAGVKIGNFVEVKKTVMGEGSKASHLSYLGDGIIGANVNLGAGTIFCNYDGYFKYQTNIEDGAFVGSNAALVAPITIGKDAFVGSGSVVTEDVASGSLAIGRARQTGKDGWATTFHAEMAARKKEEKKTKKG
ncbi:MAG: bifunctional UDP-N-acetylglucosamine diphosphorylase/glucosamine-1-phosphate N-acetyltransferase GlmU [Pseudomonadota bacterium]